ncbi:MAG: carbamoyl-phosphate synthase, large subunit, partial [Sedimentibacter sp.]|nr:carbamoyl-phosphate synthase, large subunit [Sedimentibacter sp.]
IVATIRDRDKENFKSVALKLYKMGYKFAATENTAKFLQNNGIEAVTINKVRESKPNITDLLKSGKVGFVVNIPTKANDSSTDGFRIRRCAIEANINVFTSLDTVNALADVMESCISEKDTDTYNIGTE